MTATAFTRSLGNGTATTTPMPDAALFLMPGLDGTGHMFERFLATMPRHYRVHSFSYPTDVSLTYEALTDWVLARLPPGPLYLIGESFSGPLAVMVARRCSQVRAVVLCATFVEPPFPRALSHAPAPLLRQRPPILLTSLFLTGGDAELARAARRALDTVAPDVVASRIRSVLNVDCRRELLTLTQPLLYLNPTHDHFLWGAGARAIRALRPDAAVLDVQGPHLLLQANPHECWAHIAPFLERAGLDQA